MDKTRGTSVLLVQITFHKAAKKKKEELHSSVHKNGAQKIKILHSSAQRGIISGIWGAITGRQTARSTTTTTG